MPKDNPDKNPLIILKPVEIMKINGFHDEGRKRKTANFFYMV
jgi:hypothetical protein